MKFLIQKINGEIRHDFAFTLLESVRFKNWFSRNNKKDEIKIKYLDTVEILEPSDIYPPTEFKSYHRDYVPVGSNDFVIEFIEHFYGLDVKPINVPKELWQHPSFDFIHRKIYNGTHLSLENHQGKFFVKSNDKIKYFSEVVECRQIVDKTIYSVPIPVGNYQISEYLNGIESEWRAFVFRGKLVGLQNYCGDFTKFPNVNIIKEMIKAYGSAPVAYTLDVGVGAGMFDQKRGFFLGNETFIIEVNDFFSCGLYGFANHAIYPLMLHNWFWQFIQIEMVEQRRDKV
jgi:hypothetical protein